MNLHSWSWIFLSIYIAVLCFVGWRARRRVSSSDDYATARHSYGPVVLGLAFAATTASGVTFLGNPGLTYKLGYPYAFSGTLFPFSLIVGVLIGGSLVMTVGNQHRVRTIPEFLSIRYSSRSLLVTASLFNGVLIFYIAGQLVAGVALFESLLGLGVLSSLAVSASLVGAYLYFGGAHADIRTDAIQCAIMLAIAALIVSLFIAAATGDDTLDRLREQDSHLVALTNPGHPLTDSWLDHLVMLLAYIPMGFMPHIANKFWALKRRASFPLFVIVTLVSLVVLVQVPLAGLMVRASHGQALADTNQVLPTFLSSHVPIWLGALIGIAVLAAVMLTTDGLVISIAQGVSSDLYRRWYLPRRGCDIDNDQVEKRSLAIARVATIVVLLLAACLGYTLQGVNTTLIVMIGLGGTLSALAGPLLLGSLWPKANASGAIMGFVGGAFVFSILYSGALTPAFDRLGLETLTAHTKNFNLVTLIGEIASIFLTIVGSLATRFVGSETRGFYNSP